MSKYERTFAVVDTKVLALYSGYPTYNQSMMFYKFSNELMFTRYAHVMMKQGSPLADALTNTLERLHAMGFPNHFIWMRLPIEADDWGS